MPSQKRNHYVILSPHLDDAALSLGGAIAHWRNRQARTTVVTITAGDPPEDLTDLPAGRTYASSFPDIDAIVARRRSEDFAAMSQLAVEVVHLPLLDAIYRQTRSGGARCQVIAEVFSDFQAADSEFVDTVTGALRSVIDQLAPTHVVAPIGIGGHIDHVATRRAAELLLSKAGDPNQPTLWHYEDVPYNHFSTNRKRLVGEASADIAVDLSSSDIAQGIEMIRCYATQIPCIFAEPMRWIEEIFWSHAPLRLWSRDRLCEATASDGPGRAR